MAQGYQEYTGDKITEEMKKETEEGTEICGVKVVLTEDGHIAGLMFSSNAAHKIEMLAGVNKGYISNLVAEKFEEALKDVAREISKLHGKTYDNAFSKFLKFMESQFDDDNSDA